MKGKDLVLFILFLSISALIGLFLIDKNFDSYSDLITFLSIIIGFEIASLAILFNNPLKKELLDANDILPYKSELHRVKDYYRHSIAFGIASIVTIFIYPETYSFKIGISDLSITKSSIVLPILIGSTYCLYKICKVLFRIFTYPTNH
jgi:hypothetical protein